VSVTYFLNWMGPISEQWYTDRGLTDNYSAGRIDIRDSSKEGYEGWVEYAVPPMVSEDWYILGYWLGTLETTEVWDYEMLISIFEGEVLNGRKIRWWKDDE
jgi:hypothetical protein